jgi:hypothetical protein
MGVHLCPPEKLLAGNASRRYPAREGAGEGEFDEFQQGDRASVRHHGRSGAGVDCSNAGEGAAVRVTTDWRLDRSKINDLQQASIEQLVRMAKHAHFVNVRVRIDGEWRELEADWIKYLEPQSEQP